MSTFHKVCPECGVPIEVGLASCPHCGAQVGTLFSETNPVPVPKRGGRSRASAQSDEAARIEKAKDRSNNSLVLGLSSFFCPGIGFVLGLSAILMGYHSLRVLKEAFVEEGRGLATAGVVTGIMGIIAQTCYLIYFIRMGIPFAD